MEFTKITSEELVNKGIEGLSNPPGLATGEMQRKFDELSKEVIIPHFNELSDQISEQLGSAVTSPNVTNVRLSVDNTIQVSTDGGETYEETASSGHKVMNGAGATFPQRSRLQFSANTVITDNDTDGITFISIPSGQKGDKGDTATVQVGYVTEGENAQVVNVGSDTDAIFDFVIPRGEQGNAATIQVGTVVSGENPSVSNRGTSGSAIFDFVLPKGDKGDPGNGLTLLGTYATLSDLQTAHPIGLRGNAYYVGNDVSGVVYLWDTDENTWKNIGAIKGAKGDTGRAGTVQVGTVTEGSVVAVENVGTSEDAIFNFTLKKGDKGDTGNAATISVGTVSKGDVASVVNVGTSSNAVLNFTLPKGDKGEQGNPTTINGKTGENVTLFTSDFYMVGYQKPATTSAITTSDNVMEAIGKLEKAHDVINSDIGAVDGKVDAITGSNDYTISTTWEANTDIGDYETYPFKQTVSDDAYTDNRDCLVLPATPTSMPNADEMENMSKLCQFVDFNGGVTVLASEETTVALTLRVKGV